MSGTVNIARDIWHDTAFKPQPFTEREAFVWLIMEASYKARERRVGNVTVELARGQLVASIRFMAEAWDWQKSTVDRFLKRLESRDMIGTDSGTGLTVVTICKYDEYQGKPSSNGTPEYENRDSSGTAAGQQRDKPNKGLIPDERREKEVSLGFSEFWACWPNKTAKASAEKAWRSLSQPDRICALENAAPWFNDWRKRHPDASPIHPATYLNKKRWTDEQQQPINFAGDAYGSRTTPRPGDGRGTFDAFAAVAARYAGPTQ